MLLFVNQSYKPDVHDLLELVTFVCLFAVSIPLVQLQQIFSLSGHVASSSVPLYSAFM